MTPVERDTARARPARWTELVVVGAVALACLAAVVIYYQPTVDANIGGGIAVLASLYVVFAAGLWVAARVNRRTPVARGDAGRSDTGRSRRGAARLLSLTASALAVAGLSLPSLSAAAATPLVLGLAVLALVGAALVLRADQPAAR